MGNPRRARRNQIPTRTGSGRERSGPIARVVSSITSLASALRSGVRRSRVLTSAGAASVVALAVVLVWLLWPVSSVAAKVYPPSRERSYSAYTACLVTGPLGLQEPGASAVWTGMQLASTAEAIQIRYQPVVGADTEANAATYVNTLASANCEVVLAQGDAEVAALASQAAKFPAVRFVAVGRVNASIVNVAYITPPTSSASGAASSGAGASASASQSTESQQVAAEIETVKAGQFQSGAVS
jgi:hypothetical protein